MSPIASHLDLMKTTSKPIEIVYNLREEKTKSKNIYMDLFYNQTTIQELFVELFKIVDNESPNSIVKVYKNLLNQGLTEESLEEIKNTEYSNPLLNQLATEFIKLINKIRTIVYSTIDEDSQEYEELLAIVIKNSKGDKKYTMEEVFN